MRHATWPLALIVGALLAGCGLERHAATDQIDPNDCYACHRSNYEQATDPVHVGAKPTTCRDCHSVIAWRPAGLHPDDRFPIRSGPHAAADCGECHKPALGPPQGGANTDCLTCHGQAETAPLHVNAPGYGWDLAMPHACLVCHPAGLAIHHPEDRFPIASGPHAMPCADCHVFPGPNNLSNTTCTGCHTGQHNRARADNDHQEAPGYAWSDSNPRFCLVCHPDGRNR